MRKHAVIMVLFTLELLALALLVLFWLVMRPDLMAAYGLSGKGGGAVPSATRVALSGWFVPAAGVTGALLVLIAFLRRWRARARTDLAAAGLVWTVLALAFAMWAAYGPAFEQLGGGVEGGGPAGSSSDIYFVALGDGLSAPIVYHLTPSVANDRNPVWVP